MAVLKLRNASVAYAGKEVLARMDWSLDRGSVGVVFGGGGVGKSSLLRSLTGASTPGLERGGRWSFLGDETAFLSGRPLPRVAWCGQPPRDFVPTSQYLWPALASALRKPNVGLLVLDEPNAWVDERRYDELAKQIRGVAANAAVLVSTHHVEFGRACADHVTLLGGRRILAQAPATEFFTDRASDEAKMFVRTGNVVAEEPSTPPPPGLRWVLPDRLGGMGWPGTVRDVDTDLRALADIGVTHLITLTHGLVQTPSPTEYGIESHHCAIKDMGVPTMRTALRLAGRICGWLDDGGIVVVHCRGGIGRTGLVLALVLVQLGRNAEDAIKEVRTVNRHYIQTQVQLTFVEHFEEALRPPEP